MPISLSLKLFIIYAREDQPALLELKAKVYRTVTHIVSFLLLFLFFPYVSSACFCSGIALADENIKTHDAVFIGVLANIKKTDSLFSTIGGDWPGHYYNFKVLRYNKGLGKNCDYVSVFDLPGSTCIGFLKSAAEGDTILVFAYHLGDSYGYQFLKGSQCDRYAFISRPKHLESQKSGHRLLSESEQVFVNDATQWHIPVYSDIRAQPAKELPKETPFRPTILQILLVFSALGNLTLLFLLMRNNKKS